MEQPTTRMRDIALYGLFSFLLIKVALTSADDRSSPLPLPANLTELAIPHDLGQVSQVIDVPGADSSSGRTLLLIQDTHVDYDAQKHLAAILDRLISTYGVRLVLVESGAGDVSLSSLRALGNLKTRHEVAERYLKSGVISGEEYLDVVSDRPLTLWGVEDLKLYGRGMDVVLDLQAAQASLGPKLAELHRLVTALRARLVNEPLNRFEALATQFDHEQLPLSRYLPTLLDEGKRVGVPIESLAPMLPRFLAVAQLEPTLDVARVQEEQRRVMADVRERASADALAQLAEAARKAKASPANATPFYRLLGSLMQSAHLEAAAFPRLSDYIRYVTLKADLSTRTVLAQLETLQAEVRARLIASSEEGALVSIEDGLALFERLIALQWSPKEHAAYLAHREAWQVARWIPQLQEQAARFGAAWTWHGDAEAMDRALAGVVEFYATAEARDAAIVQRSLAKMQEAGERTAVLIVGGFHTDHLNRMLTESRVRVAVVTPWVGQDDDPGRYVTILRRKYHARELP